MLRLSLLALAVSLLGYFIVRRRRSPGSLGRRSPLPAQPSRRSALTPPKPPWVRVEVLRLKALMPEQGCRNLATIFNRLHESRRGVTIGKSFVHSVLKGKEKEIALLRQKLKHRQPKPLPRNLIWAMDLTFVRGTSGSSTVLGLIDHGTRACLALRQIKTKGSIVLLRALLDAIENYGRPKALRTDNEAVFSSKLFRFGLWLLGVRHQRTELYCPWQNGRIERFFGTFKAAIRKWHERAGVPEYLAEDLVTFRSYYNFVRPHQHLGGRTPAEAWSGAARRPRGRTLYVSEWDGLLAGFLFAT